jgi:hypothetical protein
MGRNQSVLMPINDEDHVNYPREILYFLFLTISGVNRNP